SREVLLAVPSEIVEGGLSVGATKGQVLRRVVLPSAKTGIIGAVVLGAARALGETIALVLLVGNIAKLPSSLNSRIATLATELANNFGNLSSQVGFSILCCLAVVLMVIVAGTNPAARLIVRRSLQKLR